MPVPGTIVPVLVTPSGSHQAGVLEDEAAGLAAERPGDPVVADVSAAALGLGDHQLGGALALQIAA